MTFKKVYLLWGVGAAAAAGLGGVAIYWTFVKQSRTFIFANWQNYMSPAVQEYLAEKYDTGFTNYGTNSDLVGLYVDGSYDFAIPSDYLLPQLVATGSLTAIDWSAFGSGHWAGDDKVSMLNPAQMALYYETAADGTVVGDYPGEGLAALKVNDPLHLFNSIVRQQIVNFRSYNGAKFNLLRYGVPYFMQDLVFAYRGPTPDALSDATKNYSWQDVMAAGPYFKDNVRIIDDERNVYSIGRTIETSVLGGSKINPEGAQDIALEGAFDAFYRYARNMGAISWDTDSYNVLDYLAAWQEGDAPRAAILYNGDAVYAAVGGEVGADPALAADFHVVHPAITTNVMDMVTVSSKIKTSNLDRAYAMIDELALSGAYLDAANADYQAEQGPDDRAEAHPWWDGLGEEDMKYRYLSMQNFDNVNYVAPLRDMAPEDGSGYFSDYDEYTYAAAAGGPATSIHYEDLFKNADGEPLQADAAGRPLDPEAVYDGTAGTYALYAVEDENGAWTKDGVRYATYAASPTVPVVNAFVETYAIDSTRITPDSVEVPFTDRQQFISLRYFSDMKYKL